MKSLRLLLPRRASRRKLFFAVSIAIPVFLVLYSEYVSSQAAKRDRRHGLDGGGAILQALSVFRPEDARRRAPQQQQQQVVSFHRRPTFSNVTTAALVRQHGLTTNQNYALPPLHTILAENRTIIGDPQILLHYAIIGFGKCGTTSMLHLLQTHNGLQSLESEVWAFVERNPARLIERLHKKLGDNLPRGYKCPGDVLADYALDYYRQYWPQTRLIIGVRHPVLWFQSLYNFRVQSYEGFQDMLEPNQLIGGCSKAMKMICTKRGHFAWYLMYLGKQFLWSDGNSTAMANVTKRRYTPLEKEIATYYDMHPIYRRNIKPMRNPVFLFDVHQLGDANETRRAQLRRDLANFLGVDPNGFRTALTADLNHVSPGRAWDAATQALKDEKKINICHTQHLETRIELMKPARLSSRWIRQTFLNSPGVYSSSREYLEELLLQWMEDPCGGNETLEAAELARKHEKEDAKSLFESSLYALPPYDTLFNETDDLIGDPQILLHFSIIGFGKCGTTTLMYWLSEHPELQCLQEEVWALPMQQPSRLLTRLYQRLPKKLRRGYKCPGDVLSNYARNFYRQYLPETKLFLGVRHPVLWFESLYNFRLQNLADSESIPDANAVVGLCRKNTKLVCTYRGNFAHHLLQWGKHVNATTRPFTPLEQQLATWYRKYSFSPSDIEPVPNEIFIFELNQLGDEDESRQLQLRRDIQTYLGLSQEFSEAAVHYTPGRLWDEQIQAQKDKLKIDICDDVYLSLRAELMLQARTSSQWIRQVFLDSPGVHVSSRPYFEALLEQWMIDPCNNKTDGIEAPSLIRNRRVRNKLSGATDPETNRGILVDSDNEDEDEDEPEALEGFDERPPLSSIVNSDGRITGDPQFLLDFAIIGFGKSGTTTMLQWLSSHPSIKCLSTESWALMHGHPQKLITRLYHELPAGRDFKRCYKCPGDISEPHILDYYRTLWPKTKLIIGVRHPVLWFQSLYNFRSKQLSASESLPHPNALIGLCYKDSKLTCTRRGHFALSLMRLGKQYHDGITRPFTDLEEQIVNHYLKHRFEPEDIRYVPNPVFLYDVSQLAVKNEALHKEFAEDLTDFLDLEQELPEIPSDANGKEVDGPDRGKRKINICDDEYIPVRKELMELARLSSRWIREVFLDLPGVSFPSSREHMENVFSAWMHDPCEGSPEIEVA